MKVMLVGFGKVNKLIYNLISSDVVGIYSLESNYLIDKPEIIIDFSTHDLISYSLDTAIKYNVPLVVGTTGHSEEEIALISEKSNIIPIFKCSNFSPGINFILKVLKDSFFNEYNSKIIETHHKFKVDIPSGSAIELSLALNCKNIESIRDGDELGIHEIVFFNGDEKISIKHEVLNRNLFAKKAIEVSRWVLNKKPGFYSYEDYIYDR